MSQNQIRDFSGEPAATTPDALPLVSCFWCERRHQGEHPLSVCRACAARYSTMRLLEMSGSYPLSDAGIDAALSRTAPGNYALGYLDDGAFHVFYVGRSDTDVKQRLHEWVDMPSRYERYASTAKAPWEFHYGRQSPVGAPSPGRVENGEISYTRFAYSYSPSAEEAYAKEWRNYDTFGGDHELDNQVQPVSFVD